MMNDRARVFERTEPGLGHAPSRRCLDEATIANFVCGGLNGQQLRDVEAHLCDCGWCQSVVADAAAGVEPELADADIARPREIVAGKYRIERLLGRGGMGSVWEATTLVSGERVAIKLLHAQAPEPLERFLREGRTGERLDSQHIVRVLDTGWASEREPFIVMEALTGCDLAQLIARGPLPIADAVRYARQVCSALALAHARGVVHRDLKPSNLFAAECADGITRIKVLDFGLAKYFTGMDASLPLTGGNAVMGSPRYMSPEQMRASKDVDLRTDLWSLGAILYELLTGSAPFAQRSILALCEAVSSSAPLPPSVLRGAIPPALDDVVLRCLKIAREERFASAAELSIALAALGDRGV
jgi:serine/threonine-protein kinase